MEAPLVSVVVPTRDRPDLLAQTLQTICAQRDVALEVVVVDDGSRVPATQALVSRLGDPRVRVLRNERSRGVSATRNRGLTAARAPWVAFCDDDDLWAPDKLRRQLDAAEATGAGWVVAGAVAFLPSGELAFASRPPAEGLVRALRRRNVVPGGCSGVLARRELVQAVGSFDERLRTLADWDLWLRLARRGEPAVVDAPLVAYRLHTGNMSSKPGGVLEELHAIEAATADLRDGAPVDPAWLHRWLGQSALRAGARGTALACYLRAVRWRRPESLARPLVALLGHRVARWLAARRSPVDATWVEPVQAWLAPQLARAAGQAPGAAGVAEAA